MTEEKRRLTMQDVAHEAGVSQSTVSFVLNGVEGVRIAEATRQRVLEVADRMGYARRSGGAPQKGQRHSWIGMLVDEIMTSPFAALSVEGAQEAAWEHGRLLVSAKTGGKADREEATLEHWKAMQVEGVIYASILTREVTLPPALDSIPTVLLNCYEATPRFPAVVPSEVMGGFAATEALIQSGHRRIAFIHGEPWMEAARDRFAGYRQALATHDIPFQPDYSRTGNFLPSGGYEATCHLLALKVRPTAIFCANDLMALGCYEALKEAGLQIPQDVAVMGYDDQEVAQHLSPALSTVLLPHLEMGRWAVEQLVLGARTPSKIKLECPVVMRHSI